jgi:hypothetical protein
MSGSFVFDSGVGTQIEIASTSARRPMSMVASTRPALRSAATSAVGTSGM